MRVEKQQLAAYVADIIQTSPFVFFITFKGMSVLQFGELRDKLHAVQSKCHVLKNSLITLGLARNDVITPANFQLTGDTAAVFGAGDPTVVAKVIKDYQKNVEHVSFKAGIVNGQFLPATDMMALAALPAKEIVQAQLLGVLQAPMRNLVGVLNAKVASIVYVLQSYLDKKEKSG